MEEPPLLLGFFGKKKSSTLQIQRRAFGYFARNENDRLLTMGFGPLACSGSFWLAFGDGRVLAFLLFDPFPIILARGARPPEPEAAGCS